MSTFNELIDFTRSTTGTYLDSVVYGSESVINGEFNDGTTGWSAPYQSTISTVNNALRITSTNDNPYATQDVVVEAGKKYVVTFNVLARSAGSTSVFFGSETGLAKTDLGSHPILPNDFYVFNVVATTDVLNIQFVGHNLSVGNYFDVDNVSVKEVIGGQVSGTPLLRTAAINEPRLEYDASGQPLGLLIEEQRTNKVPYSQDFTNDNHWSKQEVTVATAPVAAPDGTMTATHVVKTGGSGHLVDTNIVTTSDRHSIWARSVSGTGTIYIAYQDANALITLTEEWQRFDVQCNNTHVYAVNFRGSATLTECYIWGSQAETGTFPTSYIPTSGSTVTRAIDSAVATLSDFYYRQKNGSMVVEFTSKYNASTELFKRVCEIGNTGTPVNRLLLFVKTDETRLSSSVYDNTNPQYGETLTTSLPNGTGVYSKAAFAWETNNANAAFDGDLVGGADTAVSLTQTRDTLGIMRSANSTGDTLTGHIKSIQYYPLRVADAKLEILTGKIVLPPPPTGNLTLYSSNGLPWIDSSGVIVTDTNAGFSASEISTKLSSV